jgi:hypothetical protein
MGRPVVATHAHGAGTPGCWVGGAGAFGGPAKVAGGNTLGAHERFNATAVANELIKHHNAVRAAAYIFTLGVAFAFWWFGALWRRMVRAEGTAQLAVVAAMGLTMAGAIKSLQMGLESAIVWRPQVLGAAIVDIYAIAHVAGSVASMGLFAMVAAVTALNLRTHFLPSWLSYEGAVAAALWAVGALGMSSFNGLEGLTGLAFVLWSVWILGISWTIWRSARAQIEVVVEVVS